MYITQDLPLLPSMLSTPSLLPTPISVSVPICRRTAARTTIAPFGRAARHTHTCPFLYHPTLQIAAHSQLQTTLPGWPAWLGRGAGRESEGRGGLVGMGGEGPKQTRATCFSSASVLTSSPLS